MNDIFDRIAASTPLNKTAGVVTSRSRDGYTPQKRIVCAHADVPLPTKAFPIGGPASLINLTGRRFGRLVVIGLLDAPKGNHGLRWVVRCACGRYETRVSKSINRPQSVDGDDADRCQLCAHTQYLRREGQRPRTVEAFLAGQTK